ncbi:MAG: hypothetical protein LBH87_00725 [Coriobacteriales bacterium]|nr:hypothetical protein [Coriobacteriales bacterium]
MAPTKTATKTAPSKEATAKQPSKKILFDSNEDRFTVANQAAEDPDVLHQLVENLSTDARRMRQFSAGALAVLADLHPDMLLPYCEQLIDALHRPEAQTRWEILEALISIIPLNPDVSFKAVAGAEASLYDEDSGTARLSAVRFLATYGAIDDKHSEEVWPLLDEAIQCYHGDPEFQEMLVAIIGFASGQLSQDVRKALLERVRFDAETGKGLLQRRTEQIVELCSASGTGKSK